MNRKSVAPYTSTVDKDLKSLLHRFIIDALEDDKDNLLEGPRNQLSHFVGDKVHDYTRRRQMAISRYEVDRLTEELVDELTEIGRAHV